jgi:hypothetical protein
MEQVSLYYPYIEPPVEWMKQALLISDAISSIVPPNQLRLNDDMTWLSDQGLWRGTLVRWPYGEIAAYRSEIEGTLLEFADVPRYRIRNAATEPRGNLTGLHLGKLQYEVEDALTGLQLAARNHHGEGLLVHAEVAGLILSITAKYLCSENRDPDTRLIPATDQPTAARYAHAPLDHSPDRSTCYELLLAGLTPVPGPGVPLGDIVDFRTRYRDELLRFRQELSRLVDAVRLNEDPLDAVRSARQDLEAAISNVKGAASQGRGLRLVAGAVSVLGLSVVARHLVPEDTIRWVFDGFGTTASAIAIARVMRRSSSHQPFSYLVRAADTFSNPLM